MMTTTPSFLRRLRGGAAGLTTLGLLASASLAAAAPQPETGWHMPRDVSIEGHRIDELLGQTNVLITILFIVMAVWMLWAAIVHNRKQEATYEDGSSKKSMMFSLALLALVFFVVDGNLEWHSNHDVKDIFWNFERPAADPNVVRIEVNARQWIWQARYAGPDKEFNTKDDIVTTNDIRVPVDTPILLQLASPDVLHNMYLPNLRIKADVVPGSINQMWFQAKETGEFEIGCAQHCGANHYKMRGVLTILPKDAYEAWTKQATVDSSSVFDDDDKEAHWGWAWRKI